MPANEETPHGATVMTISGIEGLNASLGQELGVSDSRPVSQPDIDAFAEVTGDHQWIHVDVERASESAFAGTIAHGYYTLSLGPALAAELYTFAGFSYALNYGLEKVRFPAPMPVGERLRMRAQLSRVTELDGAVQVMITQTFEREGAEKPVCVAEQLVLLVF
jgi:acyl dehydratase